MLEGGDDFSNRKDQLGMAFLNGFTLNIYDAFIGWAGVELGVRYEPQDTASEKFAGFIGVALALLACAVGAALLGGSVITAAGVGLGIFLAMKAIAWGASFDHDIQRQG